MRGRISILAASATLTLLSLASPLSAAPQAGKTPLKIDAKGAEHGDATFVLIGANSADSDSGALTRKDGFGDVKKSGNGHGYALNNGTSSFKGKRGTLVLRTTGTTYFMDEYEVWIGA